MSQTGFTSFVIIQMLQLHTIQQMAAQEVLMPSNQVNRGESSKSQVLTIKTGKKNIKLGKNEKSCSPYFEAEDSVTRNMESTGIPLIDAELLQEASDSIIKLVKAKDFKDELGKLKQKERSLSYCIVFP